MNRTAGLAGEDHESLFREHYSSLVRFAARILGAQAEAEDIAVEAFVRLIRERSTIRNRTAWLKQCVVNLALDRLRSNHRRTARERQCPPAPDAGSPETELIAAQEQARVRFVLSTLSHRDAVLLLGRADGHSYHELAELAGLRLTSIGATLAKAQKHFKEKYQHYYGTR